MSKNSELLSFYTAELTWFYRQSQFCSINWVKARDYERNRKWIAAYLIGNGVNSELNTLAFEFHREQ